MFISHALKLHILFSDDEDNDDEESHNSEDNEMEVLEEDMIDIIRNNGLTTSLYLSYVHNGLRNNSVNYSQLGALIGNNTHLTQLDIDVPHVPESQEANAWESDADESALADSRGFFEAIATNTSIQQLRMRYVDRILAFFDTHTYLKI